MGMLVVCDAELVAGPPTGLRAMNCGRFEEPSLEGLTPMIVLGANTGILVVLVVAIICGERMVPPVAKVVGM